MASESFEAANLRTYLARIWTFGQAPGVADILLFNVLVVATTLLVTNLKT